MESIDQIAQRYDMSANAGRGRLSRMRRSRMDYLRKEGLIL